MLVLGPDVPPALRPLMAGILEALRSLQTPTTPGPVFTCPRNALPPAEAWPQCLVLVGDLNILAHSDGSHWIRQDTGGVI